MKILARHCGGLAGCASELEIDTASAAGGADIERLLQRAALFDTPSAPALAADLSYWELLIDDGQRQQRLTIAEDGSPASQPWQELLSLLHQARTKSI
ncbi:protealysin inhibitor emfourin [Massilia sp. TS11]|uniref:protealysin inhibitor emfourin n=1 Tax=Massilia sp. TS11 TaxID=2908003 RepID=UPI001EDC7FD4|nr:protealysin inhibitor emfourin [Massilia sp. TS11]MCG2586016.1 hypothetical protein [Massilia sp. TS11]